MAQSSALYDALANIPPRRDRTSPDIALGSKQRGGDVGNISSVYRDARPAADGIWRGGKEREYARTWNHKGLERDAAHISASSTTEPARYMRYQTKEMGYDAQEEIASNRGANPQLSHSQLCHPSSIPSLVQARLVNGAVGSPRNRLCGIWEPCH